MPHLVAGASVEELELVGPHRLHALRYEDVSKRDLSLAPCIGWQFLVTKRQKVVASAAVYEGGQSAAVEWGRFAAATGELIDNVEGHPKIASGRFEFRILFVNALYLVAAWLVGDNDLLVPMEPAPWFLEGGVVYAPSEFFELLNSPGVQPFVWSPANGDTRRLRE